MRVGVAVRWRWSVRVALGCSIAFRRIRKAELSKLGRDLWAGISGTGEFREFRGRTPNSLENGSNSGAFCGEFGVRPRNSHVPEIPIVCFTDRFLDCCTPIQWLALF